jgi:hypothetical protein
LRAGRLVSAACVGALGLGLAACGDVPTAFGPDAAQARTNATQLFGGLAASFAPSRYDAKYAAARQRFSANFLAPDALWRDTSLWSTTVGNERQLHSRAWFTGSTYDQVALPAPAAPPVALGETRHRIALQSLGQGRFAWDARVEWALGPGRAAGFEQLVGLLGLAAGQAPVATWEAALPRTTRALSRLVTVDTARADRGRDGTQLVTYVLRFVPARARAGFPELADFVEKFIGRSAFDLALRDARGARWMEATAKAQVVRIRLRVAPSGALVPLVGAGAALPDTLQLVGSLYARGGWAGVEITRIVADFVLQRAGGRRGLALRWHTEPEWGFPFSVDRLIAGSLRAPFEGEGVVVEFGVEDGAQGQLLLVRRLAGHFQESRLVRWMGSLAGSVFGSWTGRVEPDGNRFLTEMFAALRDDLRLGTPPAANGDGGP